MVQELLLSIPFWLQVAGLCFLGVWLVQMLLLFVVRYRMLYRIKTELKHKIPFAEAQPGVSVVVYAHNQADDLIRNLPVILDNDYPDFEVIVVDDGSTDDTESVLTQMDQRSEHFFHTSLAEKITTLSHRKMAMLLGVKAAHNSIVLMTDAHCVPATNRWIADMAKHFTEGVDAVLGPVVYENRVGLKNRFYQWDLFDRLLDMFNLTLAVKTYGGWNCNLAFRKETVFANRNEAFQKYLFLNPGEDDLFLKEITAKKNISAACSKEALMIAQESQMKYTWGKERLKRAFTQRYYFLAPRVVKKLDVVTRMLCMPGGLAFAAVCAWLQQWWLMGGGLLLWVCYLLAYALIPYFTAKRLGIRCFWLMPLLCALITPLIDAWYAIRSSFNTKQFYVCRI
ncbi:MAG: glycosyltransferase [Bacteroidales bacterium]|nr:glycosyltransferase [Bacteroidales bacterium]